MRGSRSLLRKVECGRQDLRPDVLSSMYTCEFICQARTNAVVKNKLNYFLGTYSASKSLTAGQRDVLPGGKSSSSTSRTPAGRDRHRRRSGHHARRPARSQRRPAWLRCASGETRGPDPRPGMAGRPARLLVARGGCGEVPGPEPEEARAPAVEGDLRGRDRHERQHGVLPFDDVEQCA